MFAAICCTGCANREYVTPNVLLDIQRTDPEFEALRVFPSATFINVHLQALGDDTDVESQIGSVRELVTGKRVEIEIPRGEPGLIVGLDQHEGDALLWISFDERCRTQSCAYGFIQTDDGLFRLFHVPPLPGYAEPVVYRKRMTPRKAMERTKIYSRSKAAPVYFTMRGLAASIALEIRKRKVIDIEVVHETKTGVKPGKR